MLNYFFLSYAIIVLGYKIKMERKKKTNKNYRISCKVEPNPNYVITCSRVS